MTLYRPWLYSILYISTSFGLQSQDFRLLGEYEYRQLNTSFYNPENILNLSNHTWFGILLYQDQLKLNEDSRIIIHGRGSLETRYINQGSKNWDHDLRYQSIEAYYNYSNKDFTLSVGRKKIKWGVGYVANPTGIVSRPPGPEDSNDHLYSIIGADVIQFSFPKENKQFEILFLPGSKANKTYDRLNAFASRYYRYFAPFDMSWVGKIDQRLNYQLGYNTSVSLGNALELHGEFLFDSYNGAQIPQPRSMVQFVPDDRKTFRFLLGGQWSPSRKVNWVMEYLHFQNGYHESQWLDYKAIVQQLNSNHYMMPLQENADMALKNLASAAGVPLQKNYLFNRFHFSNLNRTVALEWVSFTNLNDFNTFVRWSSNIRFKESSPFSIFTHLVFILGGNGEFGTIGHPYTYRIGFQWLW